jgi:hypothetical protein
MDKREQRLVDLQDQLEVLRILIGSTKKGFANAVCPD